MEIDHTKYNNWLDKIENNCIFTGTYIPGDISLHPQKANCVKDLAAEYKYYSEVMDRFTDDTGFEVLCNQDGSDIMEYVGEFIIWYKHNESICRLNIKTYRSATEFGEGTMKRLFEYLDRYFSSRTGKVLHIILNERGLICSYNPKNDNYFQHRITNWN